jgi:hypothetical protein
VAPCAWGRAWPSRSRISRFALARAFGAGATCASGTRAPEDEGMRRATRVIKVCGDRGITDLGYRRGCPSIGRCHARPAGDLDPGGGIPAHPAQESGGPRPEAEAAAKDERAPAAAHQHRPLADLPDAGLEPAAEDCADRARRRAEARGLGAIRRRRRDPRSRADRRRDAVRARAVRSARVKDRHLRGANREFGKAGWPAAGRQAGDRALRSLYAGNSSGTRVNPVVLPSR